MCAIPSSDVGYAVELIVDWDPTVFRIQQEESGGVSISGPCPCCGHDVDKEIQGTGVFAFRDQSPDLEVDVIRCNCLHVHEGAAGAQGCGRYWGVEVEAVEE